MIAVKMQLMINGRYAYRGRAHLGTDDDKAQLDRLFQGALINLDPERRYTVTVTKKEDT